MADKLIINSNIGISKVAESSLSTIKKLAADFDGAVTTALNVQIPFVEQIFNAGIIGKGDEWASQADPDYMTQTGMTFADRLNTSQFASLLARTLSGTITSTEVSAGVGVYDHVIQMKASNLDPQLKSSTIAFSLGGFDFIMGGMVGNNLSVSVQGGAAPTYQVEKVGTGYFEYMASQSPSLVLPSAVAQNYVGQRSQTAVEFNDGTTFDITGLGRLDSFNLNFTNNLVTGERRIGDPLVDSASAGTGAYVRQLTRGDQRNLTVSMGVYVADDKRGYLAHMANTTVSNLKYKSTGNKKIGTTLAYNHEVEFTIPRSVITTPALGGDRKGIVTLNFTPIFDNTLGDAGIFKARIRNTSSTIA